MRKLGSIPTVIILSQVRRDLSLRQTDSSNNCIFFFEFQDSFYKYHNEEELALAHANMLDFDHPDAIDMSLFASVRALKFSCIACYYSSIDRLFAVFS